MSTPLTLIAERYRLVKLLGSGGMGVVWHAWDERLQRPVALKLLRTPTQATDAERVVAKDRAMREARLTARIRHPHAITVFDVVEHEEQPCLVMELVECTPLSELLREHGPLSTRQAARVGAEVASALAAAHTLRIVHRDVKPGNVLVTGDGSALISDFGISHALGDDVITATGMMHGTPAYLAPEVARGQPSSFASDVFSLGSTLYAMLEGAPPFGAGNNPIALLHKVAAADFEPPAHAGPLTPLVLTMLSPDPKQRPTMKAVAFRLAKLHDAGGPAQESPLPTVPLAPAAGLTPSSPRPGRSETAVAETVPAEPAADEPVIDEPAADEAALDAPARDADRDATEDTRRIGSPEETEHEGITRVSPPVVPAAAAAVAATPPAVGSGVQPTAPTEPVTADLRAPTTERLVQSAEVPTAEGAGAPTAEGAGGPVVGDEPTTPVGGAEYEPRRAGRRGRAAAIIALLVLAAGLALVAAFSVGTLGGPSGDLAEPTTSPSATASSIPTPDAAPPAAQPTSPEPVPTPAPPAQAPPVTREQQLAETLVSYYSLIPDNLDEAWLRMTADYQANHVGGREYFEEFWSEVSAVEISEVGASGPDYAQATLTYYFVDGRVVQEVTAYRMVDEEGTLKIAATEVLSSVTL